MTDPNLMAEELWMIITKRLRKDLWNYTTTGEKS